ncbi:lysylphosphatidylglycerol synthase transmembrane domain-containing protein [Rhodoferax sp. TBRC 17198]|uniref:lysylphosphatidylglycerol synthase transmembrane domain-containing protein n=1 Tax=Rhodoferax potami TaxID=3068338 RepID=UPI0028BD6AB1|nr:lysylphosphatidylglycerol synthase transmembrane domain-containing protein [Rhodoferax sp. TBRC 17198]MDT7521974.1 lysylphosphatidylglycerol synthase transmembrane domain-containing protein [Rhodoferax sp. TBRC 17198]
MAICVAAAVAAYAVIIGLANWERIMTVVTGLTGQLWLQLTALSLTSYLLRFLRWHYFISALSYTVPIFVNLEIYLTAFALTLTPGKVGEVIRSVYLRPYGVSYTHSLGAFVSERLLDLMAVSMFATLVILVFPEQRSYVLVAASLVFALFFCMRTRLLHVLAIRFTKISLIDHPASLIATIKFLLAGKGLTIAALLSVMAWLIQGVSLYVVVRALGFDIPLGSAVAIYCLSILAGAFSFIPGGIGVTEGAIVLLLIASGVEDTVAITAAVIGRGITLWLAIAIGIGANITKSLRASERN